MRRSGRRDIPTKATSIAPLSSGIGISGDEQEDNSFIQGILAARNNNNNNNDNDKKDDGDDEINNDKNDFDNSGYKGNRCIRIFIYLIRFSCSLLYRCFCFVFDLILMLISKSNNGTTTTATATQSPQQYHRERRKALGNLILISLNVIIWYWYIFHTRTPRKGRDGDGNIILNSLGYTNNNTDLLYGDNNKKRGFIRQKIHDGIEKLRSRNKRLPKALADGLADIQTTYDPTKEIPFFWNIHFSGETLVERVFRKCYFLIQACEHGKEQPNYNDEKLEVFENAAGSLYVNVDITSKNGIKRAASLNIGDSKLAEVMTTPLIHELTSQIFNPSHTEHKGRMFTLFRNPIDRSISMYYYLSTASWDPLYNPDLKDMTLIEYASSGYIENNWVTRFLVNKPRGKLVRDDVRIAKEILGKKCLIGLYEDIDGSIARFSKYFHWETTTTTNNHEEEENNNINNNDQQEEQQQQQIMNHDIRQVQEEQVVVADNNDNNNNNNVDPIKCRQSIIEAGDPRHKFPDVDKKSKEWKAIMNANRWDLELYDYAKILYKHQGEKYFNVV